MRFANTAWNSKQGPAEVKIGGSPKSIHDAMIANVFMFGLCRGRNDGIGQGVIHAATWYMKATSYSRWGALPALPPAGRMALRSEPGEPGQTCLLLGLAQAGDTGDGVVPLIRAINDLADRAIQRVYREERTGRIPAPGGSDLAQNRARRAFPDRLAVPPATGVASGRPRV